MKKGFWLGSEITPRILRDILVEENIKQEDIFIFVPDMDIKEKSEFWNECYVLGFRNFIYSISWTNWKETIEQFDGDYYIDEPFIERVKWYMKNEYLTEQQAYKKVEEDLIERIEYVKQNTGRRFIIGDIREFFKEDNFFKRNVENYGLFNVAYTSYTSTWILPKWLGGKVLAFGLPNQVPTLRKIFIHPYSYLSLVWSFGKDKTFCHPDEYHKIQKFCDRYNIYYNFLYLADSEDGNEKITKEQAIENVKHFLKGQKPYTFFQWWKRFFTSLI